ncbi:CdaR family protein [Paenibacillus sp. 481]|uniref:CdaR family protein n=1 Tax=Paenibacillus sp. 481 TaxID=2835869 RepID=UPI001E2CD6E9|nr:CdaR family protein [Paenibacillus sp. 481]UHA71748.1 hypothetical protein KIK04_13280 [Paenibacillus sp. 481]
MDKWLMNNNVAKIIALAIGVLLFAVVHKDDPTTTTKPSLLEPRWIEGVKIQTVGLDPQLEVKSLRPETARIQVRGNRSKLNAALPEHYQVSVDVTGYGPGRHVISLDYKSEPGIDLLTMQPSVVTVELEEVQTKQVEVRIKTQGVPAEGYKAGTPIIRPSERVHVTLPKTRMSQVKSVSAVVSIDKANETVIHKQVKLTAYDSRGREVKGAVITPSVVEVEVPITKPFKTVPLQVNTVGELPTGLAIASLEPSVNEVTVYGPQQVLNRIEFYDSVQVDLSKFSKAGEYSLNVQLTPPPNIEKMEPSNLTVVVRITAVQKRTITGVPIRIAGNNERLKTTIAEPSSRKFDVTVIGAPNVINELRPEDIQLIANVNDLPPGEHNVTLQVNLPRFVKREDNTVFTAKIVIEDAGAPVDTKPDPTPDPGTSTGDQGGGEDTGTIDGNPSEQPDTGGNGSNPQEQQGNQNQDGQNNHDPKKDEQDSKDKENERDPTGSSSGNVPSEPGGSGP